MKRLFLPLATVALLGVLAGSASASVKWNVKCEHIASVKVFTGTAYVHLRPGIDCAHTMKKGEKWTLPKGVKTLSQYTTSGQALLASYGRRSGIAFISGPPGGSQNTWGQESWTSEHTNATPLSVTAAHVLIAVASTKKQTIRVAK